MSKKMQVLFLIIVSVMFVVVSIVVSKFDTIVGLLNADVLPVDYIEEDSEVVLQEGKSIVDSKDDEEQINITTSIYEEKLSELVEEWMPISYRFANNVAKIDYKVFRRGSKCYLFVPAYITDCRGHFVIDNKCFLMQEDKIVTSADIVDDLFTPSFCVVDGDKKYELCVFQSDNVATIYIDTESGALERIDSDKQINENATFCAVTEDGVIDSHGTLSMHARGVSSFYQADKKGYKLDFDNKINILEMGTDKNWILQANAFDATNLRNKLIYDFANDMDVKYAVDSQFTDVYFNGEYAGNYIITESINVGKERVDFDSKDDILLELTTEDRLEAGMNYFTSKYGTFVVGYPREISESKLEELCRRFDEITYLCRRCEDDKYYDILKQYLDIDSFATLYIINQLTNENDINRYSMFYCYDSSTDVISSGPVWDFDRAWGDDVDNGLFANINTFEDGWAEQLYRNEQFRNVVRNKWQEYKNVIDMLPKQAKNYSNVIQQAVNMDIIRNGLAPQDQIDWGDYEQNFEFLLKNINKRIYYVENDILGNDETKLVYRIDIDMMDKTRSFYIDSACGMITGNELKEICKLTGATKDGVFLENGTRVWDDMPITSDMTLYSYNPLILKWNLTSQQ